MTFVPGAVDNCPLAGCPKKRFRPKNNLIIFGSHLLPVDLLFIKSMAILDRYPPLI